MGAIFAFSAAMAVAMPLRATAEYDAVSAFHWVQDQNKSIALTDQSGIVWRFNYYFTPSRYVACHSKRDELL